MYNNMTLKIDCPRRIQRGMIHNLRKESRNRISPDRARRAAEILAEIRKPCINDRGESPIGQPKCD